MHEETDSYGWALCEDDEIRLGPSIHKDLEMKDSEVVTTWQGLLDNLEPLVDCLGQQGICSPLIVVCIYLNTCTPSQLGRMGALMRKVKQWSPETKATFQPPKLLDELQKEFCDEKFNEQKSCIAKALDRLNKYISSMRTLQGRHTPTRIIAIRLASADAEEQAQYMSGAHLLQWVPSTLLDKFYQGAIMRSLRYLQIEGYLNKEELLVPRADKKKKKRRGTGVRRTSHDMMFNWINYERGQLALAHPIPIPPEDIHTVRAVPEIINSLIDKEKPSLCDLATWTNQHYNSHHLNIRQIIDGDILQVLNAIHLSGLLVQGNMGGRSVSIPDTEDKDDQEEEGDEEEGDSSGGPDSL